MPSAENLNRLIFPSTNEHIFVDLGISLDMVCILLIHIVFVESETHVVLIAGIIPRRDAWHASVDFWQDEHKVWQDEHKVWQDEHKVWQDEHKVRPYET